MPLPSRSTKSGARSRRACSVLAVGALGVGVLAALPSAAADAATGRISYPGSVPSLVRTAPDLGADSATDVEGEIFLNLKDTVGAQAFATAVSTPGNAQYGHFLSPAQWIAKYAPSQSSYDAVASYLRASGATIIGHPASREYIVFSTPKASTTTALFGTTLHDYRYQGKTVSAPSRAASLPASIGKYVLGVNLGNAKTSFTHTNTVQLDPGSSATPAVHSKTPQSPKAVTGGNFSCSDYYGEIVKYAPKAYGRTAFPTNICGYSPAQLRSAAGLDKQVTSGVTGKGQTIGIVDAYDSPSMFSDANEYFASQGAEPLTSYKDVSFRADRFRDKAACAEPAGWQTEQTLDVESAHSIAPGATILYSGGFDCGGGIDLSVSKILDNGLANIVSNSYGDGAEPTVPIDYVRGASQYYIQAAGEGIGLYFSTGDDGDTSVDNGYASPEFSASSPFVTAVGGTSEAIGGNGQYQFETGWGDILDQFTLQDGHLKYTAPLPGNIYGGGGGGGVSSLFAEPDYQKGVVPDALATSVDGSPSRVIPDIADNADPYTGFRIGYSPIINNGTLETGDFTYDTYGGTSLASPIAAAKMAMVQAATGLHIGFANPALYAAAKADPASFHDVTTPKPKSALYYHSARSGHFFLITLNEGLSLYTGAGYDTMTGIGSLVVPALASYLGSSST